MLVGVLQLDPWLEPFQDALKRRYAKAQDWIKSIDDNEGGLEKFSRVRVLPTLLLPPDADFVAAATRALRNSA